MQRLNHGEGAENSGTENREQSQEARGTVQGDIRDGFNLNEEESQSSSQSRAASAIQDRWRRYRQRKAEEEAENTPQNMETDTNMEDDLDSDDDEIEIEKSCSSSVLCCGSNRVSPKPDLEDSSSDKQEENDKNETPSLKKIILTKYRNEQNENEETSEEIVINDAAICDSDKGEKSKINEQIESEDSKQIAEENENNQEDTDEDVNMQNIDRLEDSYADLRETGVEPTLEITYRNEGTSASSISIGECEPLPGPSRVVTGPAQVGFDPVTGARRRRSGISSVPTSSILNDNVERKESIKEEKRNIVEYETFDTDDSDDSEEEININFDDLDKVGPQSNRRTINQPPIRKKFTGHRNARTMIKEAAWWGNDFILSGSDCGHLFAWDRKSTKLVMMLEADRYVHICMSSIFIKKLMIKIGMLLTVSSHILLIPS